MISSYTEDSRYWTWVKRKVVDAVQKESQKIVLGLAMVMDLDISDAAFEKKLARQDQNNRRNNNPN